MKEVMRYECEYCNKIYDTRAGAETCEMHCQTSDADAVEALRTLGKYCRKHNGYCEYKGHVCSLYDSCKVRELGGYDDIK